MKKSQNNLDTVKLSHLKKVIASVERGMGPQLDPSIPFEYLMQSCFPNILTNIKNAMTQKYIEGYNAAKEENNEN